MATFLPFNFNPTSTTTLEGESNSYTVPSGHYAIVFYNLSAQQSVSTGSNSTNGPLPVESNSLSGWFVAGEGDALTISEDGGGSSSGTTTGYYIDSATATILCNTETVATCTASAQVYCSSTSYQFAGFARVEAQICVYAIP